MAVSRCMLLLTVVLCTACGKPTCTLYSGKDLVCRPGGSDYVLSRGLVSDNNVTTGITLRGCRISSMDQESFENLRALQYLDLAQNKLEIIELGVLDGLQRLTYLNLSRNLLTEFPLGLFDQTPNLEVLDLKSNTINNLVLGIFDPMKNLRHLDLSDNKLLGSQISVYLFDQNPNIQFIDFSRNAMNDAKDILLRAYTSIDFLNLDRCSLTKIPDFTTKSNLGSMKHLMLSTNRISKITNPTTFVNLISLEILNLAKNNIEELNENVFNPLRALRTVILLENRLKSIPDNLFQNMPKLLTINLGQNLLEDVPVNAFRGSPVKYLKLSHNRFTYLQDNFCLELLNSGGKLTKIFFNDNPWQCACLNDMLVEVKKFRIEYSAAKYKGQHPVCVTNKEFRCIRQKNLQNTFVELYDANVLAQ